jgi:hypothetical protein
MPNRVKSRTVWTNAAALVAGVWLIAPSPASATPFAGAEPQPPAPLVTSAQIFQRGRPPIYPYSYRPPRRPGGWSTYFGFVPYQKGDYETQALQRVYPQLNYPPSMRAWTPQSQF